MKSRRKLSMPILSQHMPEFPCCSPVLRLRRFWGYGIIMQENKKRLSPGPPFSGRGPGRELRMEAMDNYELQEFLKEHSDDLVSHIVQFTELMNRYQSAIKEVTTKLEILKSDFQFHQHRKGIESIQSRIKKPGSIIGKLNRMGVAMDLDSIQKDLHDIAGVRVICSYIDDIYTVAEKLKQQDDITVITEKDYIKNPKPNGYRSFHMIVEVPVFFMDSKVPMQVEVQLRTVAMDFWAALEHEMKYKKDLSRDSQEIVAELRDCADIIAETDRRMLGIRNRIEEMEEEEKK